MAAMASTKSPFSTQRTFDSTDDLLENDEDLDDVPPLPPPKHENATTKVTPFWDCRAVHWPPHSVKTVLESSFRYAKSPFLLAELLFLAVFVYLCYILPDHLVAAHQRPIPVQTISTGETLIDLTFGNDYHHNETIPGSLLTMLCFVFPVSVFVVFSILLGPQGDLHAAICAYIFAMASKIFVVACIKNYAGYLRPNFYDMCKFNPQTLLCDDETTSARESFPSGHAATALSSMTVLSLYLLGKVCGGIKQRGVKEVRGDPRDEVWTPSLPLKVLAVLSVGPVVLGMFIATSRVRDNWHHPADVLCGAVIGVACALYAHTLWYPSVYSHYGGIPLATVAQIVAERRKATAAPKAIGLDLDVVVDREVDIEG